MNSLNSPRLVVTQGNELNNAYQEAIERARQELKMLDDKVDALDRQRAKLRQTVATLQSLMGQPVSDGPSMTDAIIDFVRANEDYVSTTDVIDGLIARGYPAHPRSVATILSKLVKIRKFKKGTRGGYQWAGVRESGSSLRK
jgi:hypothetical protein